MVHLLAESAEMRGEEEIGVNARDVADRAALQRARDAADARDIAAVLHHGVNPSRDLRARDQVARLIERFRHRLFAQHMAARREPRRDDLMARRRHNDVEQQVGMGLIDQRVNVARDCRVLQAEFLGPGLGARRIEIGKADDAQIGNFRRRLQARLDSSRRSRQGRPSAPSTSLLPAPAFDGGLDRKRLRNASGQAPPCQARRRAALRRPEFPRGADSVVQ